MTLKSFFACSQPKTDSQWGRFSPTRGTPGDAWTPFWLSCLGSGLLLARDGSRPGMLPDALQCIGWPLRQTGPHIDGLHLYVFLSARSEADLLAPVEFAQPHPPLAPSSGFSSYLPSGWSANLGPLTNDSPNIRGRPHWGQKQPEI